MAFSLGLPAVAAATHKHEFSTFRDTIMDRPHSILHPLQFLNNQLSALSTFSYGSPQDTPAISTDAALSDSEGQEEVKERDYNGTQDQNGTHGQSGSRNGSKRKTARKPATSFQLAHPPPTPKHKQRFKNRSRVLLQLRQISKTHSPRPTLEVLPSAPFAHRLLKFCPSAKSRKMVVGSDDLVIVNSQMQNPGDRDIRSDEDSEEEDRATREIVAVISPPGKGDHESKDHAHIWLDGQVTWAATSINNGGYEFTSYDEHGLKTTARWIPKAPKRKRGDSDASKPSSLDEEDEKSFKFSILNPLARRHPIVGSMNRYAINVLDQYVTPSTPSLTPTANSPSSFSATRQQQSYFSNDVPRPGSIYEVDDRLKTLVLVTGIWVALVEGWSRYSLDSGNSVSTVNSSPWVNRSGSGRVEQGNGSLAGTPQSVTSSRSRYSSFSLLHRPTASTTSPPMVQRSSALLRRASSSGSSPSRLATGRNISYLEARTDSGFPIRPKVTSDGSRRRHSAVPSPMQQQTALPSDQTRQSMEDHRRANDDEVQEDEEEDEEEIAINGHDISEPVLQVQQQPNGTRPPLNGHSFSTKSDFKKQGKVARLFNYIGRKNKRDK